MLTYNILTMNQEIFLTVFHFFNATLFGAWLAVFFATWLPVLLVAFLVYYEWSMRRGESLKKILFALTALFAPPVVALTLSECIKFITPSPRPFLVLDITPLTSVSESMGSFPSSHATFFAALALTVYLREHALGKFYMVGMVLVIIGRVAAGFHFPTDVFAGFLLGMTVSMVMFFAPKFLKKT